MGVFHREGRYVTRDPRKAIAFLQKACEGNAMDACFLLGSIYDKGEDGTTDRARARELWTKACQAKHEAACAKLTAPPTFLGR
jgi:TPR repeat protein